MSKQAVAVRCQRLLMPWDCEFGWFGDAHDFRGGFGFDALETNRVVAANLALSNGARILVIACRKEPEDDQSAAVDRGLAAYAWRLGGRL